MSRLLIIGLLCLPLTATAAGAITNALVTNVRVDRDGRGMITFNTPVSTGAGCALPVYTNAFAFDSNTAGGKSLMAMAIAAKATGSSMNAYGTGGCDLYSNTVEDASYAVIN